MNEEWLNGKDLTKRQHWSWFYMLFWCHMIKIFLYDYRVYKCDLTGPFWKPLRYLNIRNESTGSNSRVLIYIMRSCYDQSGCGSYPRYPSEHRTSSPLAIEIDYGTNRRRKEISSPNSYSYFDPTGCIWRHSNLIEQNSRKKCMNTPCFYPWIWCFFIFSLEFVSMITVLNTYH